jgi:hypothetical protein
VRLIPIRLEVRRRRVRRDLQVDFDFGIVGGKANTTTHGLKYRLRPAVVLCLTNGR